MKAFKTTYYYSPSFDPWFNLAVEEQLMNLVEENEVIFYLWQNKDTVVIGRNQNPWAECHTERMKSDGVCLARRLSGGGAVYHDLGNLNFTFITGKPLYDLNRQLTVILNAVKRFGIHAEFTGRNDITVEGKKFSGNAFFHTPGASLHHGTLLIHSDIGRLGDYLNPSKEKIESKGVKSVKSRVVNLGQLEEKIDVPGMKSALLESFQKEYACFSDSITLTEDSKNDSFVELHRKYASWDWRMGKSPNFDTNLRFKMRWGEVSLGFKIVNGIIENTEVYSDALDVYIVEDLKPLFLGIKYSRAKIAEILEFYTPASM